MASTFADGTQTDRFDPRSSAKQSQALTDIMTRVEELEKKCRSYQERFDNLPAETHNMCQIAYESAVKVAGKLNEDTRIDVRKTDDTLERFLKSRLVRFLNFFGQWFIYVKNDDGEWVFENIPINELYGKAPLLTRVRRWFRKIIKKKTKS